MISNKDRSAEQMHMKMKQVSDNCYAVLCEKNRVCDANSGLINRGGGMVVDTQSDLPLERRTSCFASCETPIRQTSATLGNR
jgi:hypothetical protein